MCGLAVLLLGAYFLILLAITHNWGGSSNASLATRTDIHTTLAAGSSGSVETMFVGSRGSQNRVTVTGIEDPAPLDPARAASPGYHFVAIHVAVENTAATPTILKDGGGDFISSFFLRTTDGTGRAPTAMTSVLTFEVADGYAINWLKFNPNLLDESLFFDATPAAAATPPPTP